MENIKNVLTAQIAAMYYGSELRITIEDISKVDTYVTGITLDKMESPIEGKTYQLILKPLSEISDEDAIKVAQIADLPEWYRKENWLFDYTNNITIGRGLVNDFYEDYGDPYRIAPKKCNEILKYLRSKLYDCDNLLETGIAIKSDSDGK